MNSSEKVMLKHKLGLTIQKILKENKDSGKSTITSIRKLAASSGVEYAIVQQVSSGKKDPQFTTLMALAEGLDLSIVEFLSFFITISDRELSEMIEIAKQKKENKK